MEILAATLSQTRPFADGRESVGSTAVAFDQFLAGLLTSQAVLHTDPDFQAFQAGNSAGNTRSGQRDAAAPVKNDPPAQAAKENDRASRNDEPTRRQAAEESRQRPTADRPATSGETRRGDAGTEASRAPASTGTGETRSAPPGAQTQASTSTETPKQNIQAGKDVSQTFDLHVTVERPQPTPSSRSVLAAGSSLVAMTAAQNQAAQNQVSQNQGPALALESGGPPPTQATSTQTAPVTPATPGAADGQAPAGASDPSLLAGADAAKREDPRTAARRAELRPTAATPASPAMTPTLHPQAPLMNGAAPSAASPTAQAAVATATATKGGGLPGGGAEPLPATASAKAAQVTSFLDTLSLAQGQTADGALKAARPNAAQGAARPARMQVAVQIRQAVATGRDKISIQLHPSELGRVDIKLKMDHDGKVRAHIAADRPETLDLLMRDARGLERALQDAGLKTDSGSLTFQRHDSGGQAGSFLAQQEQSGGQQSYGGGSAGAAQASEQPTPAPAGTADDGRLNIQV